MTPQAMGELVDHLAARGYLERVPDPNDRRAKLIVLTDLGYDALQAAFDTIIGIEAELEEFLGRDGLLPQHGRGGSLSSAAVAAGDRAATLTPHPS
jgi:DNA-binding MarR family transcriptional regulator